MSFHDRRQAPRFDVAAGIAGMTSDGTRITLLDISATGCLVHAQKTIAIGDVDTLHFRIGRDDQPVSLQATAVHTTPAHWVFTPSHIVGMQVQGDGARRLQTALRTLLPVGSR